MFLLTNGSTKPIIPRAPRPEESLFDCRIIVSCFSRSPRYPSSLRDKARPGTAYFSLLLPSGNAIPGSVRSIDVNFASSSSDSPNRSEFSNNEVEGFFWIPLTPNPREQGAITPPRTRANRRTWLVLQAQFCRLKNPALVGLQKPPRTALNHLEENCPWTARRERRGEPGISPLVLSRYLHSS
jgi:hypothetical protein